jgi:apolipoprotein N-acyltransferase
VCLFWALGWAALGCLAIYDERISLGGRLRISYYEGRAAVVTGFLLLGVALAGLYPLLDHNRWKRHICALAVLMWLGCFTGYLYWLRD